MGKFWGHRAFKSLLALASIIAAIYLSPHLPALRKPAAVDEVHGGAALTEAEMERESEFHEKLIEAIQGNPSFSPTDRSVSRWIKSTSREINFDGYHPQGIKKIGDKWFLSTVDKDNKRALLLELKLNPQTRKYDLVKTHVLTESVNGTKLYHPGGIDFNSRTGEIIIPIADYAKHTKARVIAFDPLTGQRRTVLAATEDHLGGVVADVAQREMHFLNYGSENTYTVGEAELEAVSPDPEKREFPAWQMRKFTNPKNRNASYGASEYQDCKHLGKGLALCSAKKGMAWTNGSMDLLEFQEDGSYKVLKRVPVPNIYADGSDATGASSNALMLANRPLTFNAMDFEAVYGRDGKLAGAKFYFAPHDGAQGRIYEYYLKF